MKVSTAAGRTALERAKPNENPEGMTFAKGGSACDYGPITLILEPFAQPDRIRNEMRTRGGPRDRSGTPVYKDHDPVPGVGEAAFFEANSSFANLYVWTGSRHFWVQLSAGFADDANALKPNVIELAKAIVPQLR